MKPSELDDEINKAARHVLRMERLVMEGVKLIFNAVETRGAKQETERVNETVMRLTKAMFEDNALSAGQQDAHIMILSLCSMMATTAIMHQRKGRIPVEVTLGVFLRIASQMAEDGKAPREFLQ